MSAQKASPRLAEGAGRFDRLIREVKDGQIAQTQKSGPSPANIAPAFIPSPDEVWARQFMTLGIGPAMELKATPSIKKEEARPTPVTPEAPQPATVGGSFAPTLPGALGGDRLASGGKEPRRSWLGRLFRGR